MQVAVTAQYWGWDSSIDSTVDLINANYDDYTYSTSSREWVWVLSREEAAELVKELAILHLNKVTIDELVDDALAA